MEDRHINDLAKDLHNESMRLFGNWDSLPFCSDTCEDCQEIMAAQNQEEEFEQCKKDKEKEMRVYIANKLDEIVWEIALAQGAKKELKPEDLLPGEYRFELEADHSGMVTFIDSREVVDIARHLGCPLNKHAGLYFHKDVGDEVKKGDIYATVYATSPERVDMTKRMMAEDPDILIKVE